MSTSKPTPSWISWMLRAAWLLAVATFLFAGFHAADGDPLQWRSAVALVVNLLFAVVLTCVWSTARLTTWVLTRRRR